MGRQSTINDKRDRPWVRGEGGVRSAQLAERRGDSAFAIGSTAARRKLKIPRSSLVGHFDERIHETFSDDSG